LLEYQLVTEISKVNGDSGNTEIEKHNLSNKIKLKIMEKNYGS